MPQLTTPMSSSSCPYTIRISAAYLVMHLYLALGTALPFRADSEAREMQKDEYRWIECFIYDY